MAYLKGKMVVYFSIGGMFMNPEFLWLYSNLEDIIDMEFIVTTKEEEKINDRDYAAPFSDGSTESSSKHPK